MSLARQTWQVLTDLDARRARPDRPELAAILGWRIRLQVERVHVAWPAPEPQDDHGFLAPGSGGPGRGRGQAFEPQQLRQAEPTEPDTAAQERASRDRAKARG